MSWKNLGLQLWPEMFPTNQIAIFFDHHYLWKELINFFDVLKKKNHQWKVAFKTTIFGHLWSVVPFVQSDCLIDHSVWNESRDILFFACS